MSAPEPRAAWPRLNAGEAMRVRALVVLAWVLVAWAGLQRTMTPAAAAPRAACRAGAVIVKDGLRCAPAEGARASALASWWMGTAIDLNTADAETLTVVRGIGPALAARIVEDRAKNGPFATVAAVQRVRGIGPALARRIAGVAEVYASDQGSSSPSGTSNK